jgi:Trk K+ transport system NAD-binding subunit
MDWLEPFLGIFERKSIPQEAPGSLVKTKTAPKILIFGLGRFGTAIGVRLKTRGVTVLGIDFNPAAVQRWRDLGLDAVFGDASDPEIVAELPVAKAKWLLSTIPVYMPGLNAEDVSKTIIQLSRLSGFKGRVAVTARHPDDASLLADAGADSVLQPYHDAADRAVDILCGGNTLEQPHFSALATELLVVPEPFDHQSRNQSDVKMP